MPVALVDEVIAARVLVGTWNRVIFWMSDEIVPLLEELLKNKDSYTEIWEHHQRNMSE